MNGYLRRLQLRRMCAADGAARGRMNLQLFAGENTPGDGGDGAGNDQAGGETDKDGESQPGEKMLSQSEVNRIVQETIAKERARAKKQADEARTEAEKLAKMTEQQRAQHEMDKRLEELTKRETELNRRELRATAAETLAQKNLPTQLLDLLDYSNADACNQSIDTAEAAWIKAVQAGVEDRLRGKPPKAGGTPAHRDGIEAAFAAINPGLKLD